MGHEERGGDEERGGGGEEEARGGARRREEVRERACVSREFVTGLFSLLASRMWRNWLFGRSLTITHRIAKVPDHLSCAHAPNFLV